MLMSCLGHGSQIHEILCIGTYLPAYSLIGVGRSLNKNEMDFEL